MKKTDIREGVTYQTKTGNAARLVLEITDDWSKAKAEYPYLQEDAPAPYAIFKQMRGQHIGSTSALTLNSFAAWAHSATSDTEGNTTDLSDRIAKLEAACEMALETLIGCVRPGPGCDDAATVKQTVDHLRAALGDTRPLPATPGSIAARKQDRAVHLKEEASK